jgi:hypothetical protein
MGRCELGWSGACECDNEPTGCIKCMEFFISSGLVSFSSRTLLRVISVWWVVDRILTHTHIELSYVKGCKMEPLFKIRRVYRE